MNNLPAWAISAGIGAKPSKPKKASSKNQVPTTSAEPLAEQENEESRATKNGSSAATHFLGPRKSPAAQERALTPTDMDAKKPTVSSDGLPPRIQSGKSVEKTEQSQKPVQETAEEGKPSEGLTEEQPKTEAKGPQDEQQETGQGVSSQDPGREHNEEMNTDEPVKNVENADKLDNSRSRPPSPSLRNQSPLLSRSQSPLLSRSQSPVPSRSQSPRAGANHAHHSLPTHLVSSDLDTEGTDQYKTGKTVDKDLLLDETTTDNDLHESSETNTQGLDTSLQKETDPEKGEDRDDEKDSGTQSDVTRDNVNVNRKDDESRKTSDDWTAVGKERPNDDQQDTERAKKGEKKMDYCEEVQVKKAEKLTDAGAGESSTSQVRGRTTTVEKKEGSDEEDEGKETSSHSEDEMEDNTSGLEESISQSDDGDSEDSSSQSEDATSEGSRQSDEGDKELSVEGKKESSEESQAHREDDRVSEESNDRRKNTEKPKEGDGEGKEPAGETRGIEGKESRVENSEDKEKKLVEKKRLDEDGKSDETSVARKDGNEDGQGKAGLAME